MSAQPSLTHLSCRADSHRRLHCSHRLIVHLFAAKHSERADKPNCLTRIFVINARYYGHFDDLVLWPSRREGSQQRRLKLLKLAIDELGRISEEAAGRLYAHDSDRPLPTLRPSGIISSAPPSTAVLSRMPPDRREVPESTALRLPREWKEAEDPKL